MRVTSVVCKAATALAGTYGLYVVNQIKAGGIHVDSSGFSTFGVGVYIGLFVYEAIITATAAEGGLEGFVVEGLATVSFNTIHAEYNAGPGLTIRSSTSCRVIGYTGYSNGVTNTPHAEIVVGNPSAGDFNYAAYIANCNFFGLAPNVTAIRVENPAFNSGMICNNLISAVLDGGAGTKGLDMALTSVENWSILDNDFSAAATPYTPTNGFKMLGPGQDGFKGIRFSPTWVRSSQPNTLDDFEYGTWTPTLTSDGASADQTYSVQNGKYQKVGDQVTCTFQVTLTNDGTQGTTAFLGGLPFPIDGSGAGGGAGNGVGDITNFANIGTSFVRLSLRSNPTTSQFIFVGLTAAATSMADVLATDLYTNTTSISGFVTYKA
jgi:hypothetical protein